MKKIFFMLISAAFVSGTVFAQHTFNEPNAQKRDVGSFHAISVSSAIDLYLSQGDEAVAVSSSDSKKVDDIITEVENGVLKIHMKDNGWHMGISFKGVKFKAFVSAKTLDKLNASGASDIHISGVFKADDLDIHSSGASDIKGALEANKLTVNISGASDVIVTGKAETVSIDASGASDFKGYDFVTNFCSAKASGASDINITVNKEINASASGASDVHFKGEGVIRELKESGASNVSKKSK